MIESPPTATTGTVGAGQEGREKADAPLGAGKEVEEAQGKAQARIYPHVASNPPQIRLKSASN